MSPILTVITMKKTITQKMADQERPDFCLVFTMSLACTWIKTNVNKFAISTHTALKLGIQALGSHLKLTSDMSFISYQIQKLALQRIIVKTKRRSDCPWSTIFTQLSSTAKCHCQNFKIAESIDLTCAIFPTLLVNTVND